METLWTGVLCIRGLDILEHWFCPALRSSDSVFSFVFQSWNPARSSELPRTKSVCIFKSAALAVWEIEIQTKAIRRFVITEKAPTRAFSWLKAATTAFTFKTLLRHYAKQALTQWSLNVKLGPRRNYHKGRAAIRHYANQPRALWPLRRGPNFTLRDRGVNAHLA